MLQVLFLALLVISLGASITVKPANAYAVEDNELNFLATTHYPSVDVKNFEFTAGKTNSGSVLITSSYEHNKFECYFQDFYTKETFGSFSCEVFLTTIPYDYMVSRTWYINCSGVPAGSYWFTYNSYYYVNGTGWIPSPGNPHQQYVHVLCSSHTWGNWSTTKQPTCTDTGEQKHTCTVCGKSETRSVAALGHTWGNWYKKSSSTCTKQGTEARKCATCGTEETRSLPLADHKYGDWVITVQPTTDSMGIKEKTCSVCGAKTREAIAKIGGKLFPDVKNPDDWYFDTVYEASDRGLITGYSNGYFGPSDKLNRAQAAAVLKRYYDSEGVKVDVSSSKNSTGMPDVLDDRWYTGSCNWAVKTGLIKGSGGKFSPEGSITREMLCAILQRASGQYSDGGQDADKSDIYSMPDGSSVSSWARESVAWALKNGVISGKKKNGKSYIAPTDPVTRAEMATIMLRAIDAGLLYDKCGNDGHDYSYVSNDDATCTVDGTKTGVCSRCGEKETVADEGSALGHDWSSIGITQEPTCTVEGVSVDVCSRCDLLQRNPVSALGHDFATYVSNNDATCLEDGTKTQVCSRCGDRGETITDEGSALGHDWSQGAICSRCGGINLGVDGVSAQNAATYAWSMRDDGALVSGNVGVNSSESVLAIKADYAGTLTFDWSVSSEAGFDGLEIFLNGEQVNGNGVPSAYSGTKSGAYAADLAAGDALELRYVKDDENGSGDDRASVSNLAFACAHENVSVAGTEPTCTEGGSLSYSCPDCKRAWAEEPEALGHAFAWGLAAGGEGFSYTCQRCGVADESATLTAGSAVTFGSYEQDNDASNGTEPVEWRVLDVQDGKALLVSRYALDCQSYYKTYTDVTWETCTLRSWLNSDFLDAAFGEAEQAAIATSKVLNEDNPDYGTSGGNATKDKVFCLSIAEAKSYFSSSKDRMCAPTAYAVARGAYQSSSYAVDGVGTCSWWLRSPGYYAYYAARVDDNGYVYSYGYYVNRGYGAVRPALWVNL